MLSRKTLVPRLHMTEEPLKVHSFLSQTLLIPVTLKVYVILCVKILGSLIILMLTSDFTRDSNKGLE